MKKQLTNAGLTDIVDRAIDLACDVRDAAKLVDAGKVETIDAVWSQVAALQGIIADCADLTRKLSLRGRIQQQDAEYARLKTDQQ